MKILSKFGLGGFVRNGLMPEPWGPLAPKSRTLVVQFFTNVTFGMFCDMYSSVEVETIAFSTDSQ